MPNEKKKRILWLDDEPRYIDSYVLDLEEVLNVEVDLYSTVESAIYQLQNNCYDLLISDLYMPLEMPYENPYYGGAFLIKEIRSGIWDNENNYFALSKMPIILLTNAANEINYGQTENVLILRKDNHLPLEFSKLVRSFLFEET